MTPPPLPPPSDNLPPVCISSWQDNLRNACRHAPEATCLQFVEPNRQLFAPGLTGNEIPMHDLECRYIDNVRNLNNDTVEMRMMIAYILTNEKRGGLKVVAFDKSPFMLFKLRFSNKLVQAPSCKRPKTTQRTLFLPFEINNCFPITV